MKELNIYQASDISSKGLTIENNIIRSLDVKVIAHFGNCVSLDMVCENCCPIPLYNSTQNIGHIIRTLITLLGIEREDGICLSEIKNIPVRLVFSRERCVGIGHFLKDRFVIIKELMETTPQKGDQT